MSLRSLYPSGIYALAKLRDYLSKSDPLAVLYTRDGRGRWVEHGRTEWIKDKLDVDFTTTFSLQYYFECIQPLRFEVYDIDNPQTQSLADDDFLGAAECDIGQIAGSRGQTKKMDLRDPKKKAGQLVVNKFELQPTFLDYLLGGCELDLAIAVDFTKSNGDPATPQSLHHLRTDGPNDYQAAMISVGSILMNYVSDPQYPLFGFGGRVHPGSEQYPEITSPDKRYSILLIITDGIISDMDDTIQQIVQASDLPLSIVIVGVGDANFQSMVDLDCDDGLLRDMRVGGHLRIFFHHITILFSRLND
eukprot:gene2444-3178_t